MLFLNNFFFFYLRVNKNIFFLTKKKQKKHGFGRNNYINKFAVFQKYHLETENFLHLDNILFYYYLVR